MSDLQNFLDRLSENVEHIKEVLICYNDESSCFLLNHKGVITFVIKYNNDQNEETTITDRRDIEKELNKVMKDDNYYGGHKKAMKNAFLKINKDKKLINPTYDHEEIFFDMIFDEICYYNDLKELRKKN